jgi:hypothetical protein
MAGVATLIKRLYRRVRRSGMRRGGGGKGVDGPDASGVRVPRRPHPPRMPPRAAALELPADGREQP